MASKKHIVGGPKSNVEIGTVVDVNYSRLYLEARDFCQSRLKFNSKNHLTDCKVKWDDRRIIWVSAKKCKCM
jgi:hypothetical protein